MHALQGIDGYHTMQVDGLVMKQKLPILIDFSSTHNFLRLDWAKALDYKLLQIVRYHVSIANGSKIEV